MLLMALINVRVSFDSSSAGVHLGPASSRKNPKLPNLDIYNNKKTEAKVTKL